MTTACFPTSFEDYLNNTHPWVKQNAALINRLAADLARRRNKPLRDVYRKAFDDFVKRDKASCS